MFILHFTYFYIQRMQSTHLTSRFTRITNALNCVVGCLLALMILFTASIQGAGPVTAKDNNIAALVQQLGVDSSSDAATLGKLRALITQGQTPSAAVDSGEIQEGLWSGVIERVYVDNMDAQGNLVPSPTQYYLHTESEHLQVFFLDEAMGHAAHGKHMVIRGYRTGRRALVLEAGRNRHDLLRPDKPQRSNEPATKHRRTDAQHEND